MTLQELDRASLFARQALGRYQPRLVRLGAVEDLGAHHYSGTSALIQENHRLRRIPAQQSETDVARHAHAPLDQGVQNRQPCSIFVDLGSAAGRIKMTEIAQGVD
jgi:hypothetical protein